MDVAERHAARTTTAAHWTRPLKDGGVEFYARSTDGQTIKGSADSHHVYRFIMDTFERKVGERMPARQLRKPRGKWDR